MKTTTCKYICFFHHLPQTRQSRLGTSSTPNALLVRSSRKPLRCVSDAPASARTCPSTRTWLTCKVLLCSSALYDRQSMDPSHVHDKLEEQGQVLDGVRPVGETKRSHSEIHIGNIIFGSPGVMIFDTRCLLWSIVFHSGTMESQCLWGKRLSKKPSEDDKRSPAVALLQVSKGRSRRSRTVSVSEHLVAQRSLPFSFPLAPLLQAKDYCVMKRSLRC